MDEEVGSEMEWRWLVDACKAERQELIDARVTQVQADRATWMFYTEMMTGGKLTAGSDKAGCVHDDKKEDGGSSNAETAGSLDVGQVDGLEMAPRAEADRKVDEKSAGAWTERAWRRPLTHAVLGATRRLEKSLPGYVKHPAPSRLLPNHATQGAS